MDEILGKASGCSKGMGGSMHLYGKEVGFAGSVPIVAGTIPLDGRRGTGRAKKDGNGDTFPILETAPVKKVASRVSNLASSYNCPCFSYAK